MKIISFAVNNFRGITGGLEHNCIYFDDSNTIFLFGQNNVGKSTFLSAYDIFYKDEGLEEDDLFRKDPTNKVEFELETELDEIDLKKIEEMAPKKQESLKIYLREGKFLKVRKEIKGTRSGKSVKFEKTINLTFNPDTNEWDVKSYGTLGLDGIFQKALPAPIYIKAMPTEKEVEEIVNTILTNKARHILKDAELEQLKDAKDTIKDLQEKMYNPVSIAKYKDEVNLHFQRLFPRTKIEFEDEDKARFTPDKLGKKFHIHFESVDEKGEKDEAIPSSYEKIGHGAVRTAIFTLLLMQDIADEYDRENGRKDYLVLFEEPELFLHPKLMRELRDLIYRVSGDNFPYQILCASHSPQMIDVSKPKSSLVRMVCNDEDQTRIFQINGSYLKEAKNIRTNEELRQEMYEVLRFNPYICESFYADEIILVEGQTEEVILRGYIEENEIDKELFVVNCGTVTNIPFYQKIFSKFHIKYHVICDTDKSEQKGEDGNGNPVFDTGIQKSIYEQFKTDSVREDYNQGVFRVHEETFEPAHRVDDIPSDLQLPENSFKSKPFNANLYWRNILRVNLNNKDINKVPIIGHIQEIVET